MWHSEIADVVEQDVGPNEWATYKVAAEQELGQPGGLEKNAMQIAIRLAKAWEAGKRSQHLEQACNIILGTFPKTSTKKGPKINATRPGIRPVQPSLL